MDKIEQTFKNSIGKCEICFASYNRQSHTPVIICKMHHCICRQCLDIFQNRRTCPFCRQTINPHTFAVNYYIYDLLPTKSTRANSRIQINEQINNINLTNLSNISSQNNSSLVQEELSSQNARQRLSANQIAQINQVSINRRSLEFIEPPYDNQLPFYEMSQQNEDYVDIEEKLTFHKISNFIITIVQLPFILINIGLIVFYPHSVCMDRAYAINFLVLRPWLLGVSLFSMGLLASMVIINRLNIKGYLSLQKMLEYSENITEVTMAKVVIWGLIELGMFVQGMVQNCSQGLVIYGVVLILFHCTLIFLYLCHKLLRSESARV